MNYSSKDSFIGRCANMDSFLVFASTSWCPNCPLVDAMLVAENIDTSNIMKIDPEQQELSRELQVDNVPSFVRIQNGEVVDVIEGIIGAPELKELIKQTMPPEKEKVDLDTGEPLIEEEM